MKRESSLVEQFGRSQ
uniref:Uncharacterized protein n=1 Tax=Anopheles albimanus TaxID=7167 RepID=A0A182FXR1_ANOAL